MVNQSFDYKRKVTHTDYKHGNKKVKKGGFSRMLPLHITNNLLKTDKDRFTDPKYLPNDTYQQINPEAYLVPKMVGGTFLVLFLFSLFVYFIPSNNQEDDNALVLSFVCFSFLGTLFYLFYYFTMPKKECIFNRADGLVTFPGFMWRQNITMPIKDVIFAMSSPAGGLSGFQLDIVRPDKTYSLYKSSLGGNCYEDLSYLLWFMDKNRPLPPGDAFDEYRDKDFKRRKKAGFPKPLFPSDVETPEATPEQQAERLMMGGW